MIEINLIPDIKQELIRSQKTRSSVVAFSILISIIAVSAVALLSIYIFVFQSIRGSLADSDIKKQSTQLSNVKDLSKTLTIQNQLTKIASLNSNKNISSRIFDVLNKIIPPSPNNVQISNLSVDSDLGTVTIEGQAANSYEALEVFKKTISGAKLNYTGEDGDKNSVSLASDVASSNTSYGEDASGSKVLRFTLVFNYASELFAPSSKDVSISIPNSGNVTDSYLGVPQSIFVDAATDLTEGQ